MSQGIKLTITSLALGVIGALGLTRSVASVLFGVQPTDPVTFLSIAAILSVVALVASYIPAFRATKVDPMVALGYE
jgi:ABC-type antimicrobial peptide transport system permease subunit